MEYISPIITETDHSIRKIVQKITDQDILPIRKQLDDDKEHLIINKIYKKLHNLGLDAGVSLAENYDAYERKISHVTSSIITEELSRGDAGIGIVSSINGWALIPAYTANNQAIIQLHKQAIENESPVFASFAMTEPDSGCDIENIPLWHGKTIKTSARKENDSWIINGSKALVSNAGISSFYCVVCQTDHTKGTNGVALIYVPRNTPGLSFGPFEKKAGLQSDRNASIFFDNVRVPIHFRASQDGDDAKLLIANLTYGRLASGAAAVGGARGAFEEVLDYTSQRYVGGKTIQEHSIVAGMLAEMATGIETARAYYLQVAYMLDNSSQFGPAYSEKILCYASICKNYATEMAISTTNKAMELMGSYGYLRDYNVEKYWRDVKEIQLWLGGAQLGRFDIARGYYPFKGN